MTKRRSSIKGALSSMIENLAPAQNDQPVSSLPLSAIRIGTNVQPRRRTSEAHLDELSRGIQDSGVLQPLLVRPVADGYELVDGERRWRAAQLAGLTEIPVLVREMTDEQARRAALVTALQREDLETIDEVDATLTLVADALAISRDAARHRMMILLNATGPEVPVLEELFASLGSGTWQSFAKNKLRILRWPDPILAAMREQGLGYSIAGIIAAAPTEHQAELLQIALAQGSKAQVQAASKRLKPPKSRRDDRQRTILIARKLASERWLAGLNDEDEKALEAWLKKMPERIRQAVEPG